MLRTCSCLAALLFLSACSNSSKFPVRTYSMGEKVVLGSLIYTALETQWLTQLGENPAPRLPQSRFFLVSVNITNSGSNVVLSPALAVVDDTGKVYDELTNGEGAPQWVGALRQIRPAESAQGNLLFDAPPRHYRLRVTDESGERSGFIDIPLSFNAETPEQIRPAEKK